MRNCVEEDEYGETVLSERAVLLRTFLPEDVLSSHHMIIAEHGHKHQLLEKRRG